MKARFRALAARSAALGLTRRHGSELKACLPRVRLIRSATGIQRDSLRRRLNEAGMLAQNPPSAGAT